MKALNFIAEAIYVEQSANRGRGVFSASNIRKNTLIERAPVIVMGRKDRELIDGTLLHDYIFEWGEKGEHCCMALGLVPLYNHAPQSNCEYEMDFRNETISVRTIRSIKAGEELFINYNGDWNNAKKVWFEVK